MNSICPVSDKTVNENITRLNALITFLITIFILFASFSWLVFFLVPDFFVRGYFDPRYSYIARLNKGLALLFGVPVKLVNAGPKIFAARIGFIFTVVIGIFYLTGLYQATIIAAGLLGVFSGLEAFWGICVACKIYPYIHFLLYKKKK